MSPATYRAQFPCLLLATWWAAFAVMGIGLLVDTEAGLGAHLVGLALAAAGWLAWRAARARVVVGDDGVRLYGFLRTHRVPWAAVERVVLLEDRASVLPVWTTTALVLKDGRRIGLEPVRSTAFGRGRSTQLAVLVGRDCLARLDATRRPTPTGGAQPAGGTAPDEVPAARVAH